MKNICFLLLIGFCIVSCTSSHNPKPQSINSQTISPTPEFTEVIVANKAPKVADSPKKNVDIMVPNPLDFPPLNCIYELITEEKCTFKNGASIGKPD